MNQRKSVTARIKKIEDTSANYGVLLVDQHYNIQQDLQTLFRSPTYSPVANLPKKEARIRSFFAQTLEDAEKLMPVLQEKFTSRLALVVSNTFKDSHEGMLIEEIWETFLDNLASGENFGQQKYLCYQLGNIVIYSDTYRASQEILYERHSRHAFKAVLVDKPNPREVCLELQKMFDNPYRKLTHDSDMMRDFFRGDDDEIVM